MPSRPIRFKIVRNGREQRGALKAGCDYQVFKGRAKLTRRGIQKTQAELVVYGLCQHDDLVYFIEGDDIEGMDGDEFMRYVEQTFDGCF